MSGTKEPFEQGIAGVHEACWTHPQDLDLDDNPIIENTQISYYLHANTDVQQYTVEQIVDVFVSRETAQKHISEWIVEQVIDVPVLPIPERTVPVVMLTHSNESDNGSSSKLLACPWRRMGRSPRSKEVQQTVEVPQPQPIDGILGWPAVSKRQEPLIATAQKASEVTQIQFFDLVDNVPVSMQ